MNDQLRYKYPVWDRLFLLLFPCDESVTDEEVDADLKRLGVDMRPAFQRLHKLVETQRARALFATAKQTRTSIGERVRDVVAPKIEDLRTGVKNLIGHLGSKDQLAYFHKLEGAATEEDLQSLLDDLDKLAAIRELRNDSQSK
jgi:enoyl-CoA hydratase/carnithine racemase